MSILRLSTLSLTLAIAVMTLGYANPSFADKPLTGPCSPTQTEPHCHDDDEDKRDKTFYDVEFGNIGIMTIVGKSDDDHPWSTFGKGTSIGLGDSSLSPPGDGRPGIGEFTDLSFFTPGFGEFLNDGATCFPADGDDEYLTHTGTHRDKGSFSIHQGNVREGRGGRAQAGFFFHGFTHTLLEGESELREVLYHLLLTGDFASASLPPTEDNENEVVLVLTAWQLTATNEGQAVKSASCIGEGTVNVDVTVTGPVD